MDDCVSNSRSLGIKDHNIDALISVLEEYRVYAESSKRASTVL